MFRFIAQKVRRVHQSLLLEEKVAAVRLTDVVVLRIRIGAV